MAFPCFLWMMLSFLPSSSEGTSPPNDSCVDCILDDVALLQTHTALLRNDDSGSLNSEMHLSAGVKAIASCMAIGAPFLLFVIYARVFITMDAIGKVGEDQDGSAARQYGVFELHYFAMWYLLNLGTSIIIPESENLAHTLDRGNTWSGILIGAPWALVAVTNLWLLCGPSSYPQIRLVELICMFGTGAATLLSALGAFPPQSFYLDKNQRANLILSARIAMGMFEVGSTFPYLLALKVMPRSHATRFQLLKVGFTQVAVATGPYVGTIVGDLAGATRPDQRLSLALWTLGGVWMVELVLACIMLPTKFHPLLTAMIAEEDNPTSAPSRLLALPTPQLPLPQKTVWILAIFVSMASFWVQCSLQAALPTIWQNDFGLGTSDHGLLISATLASIAVFMPLVMRVRECSGVTYASLLPAVVMLLFVACLLLLLGRTLWMTVLAGVIGLNACSIACAVLDALAVQCSVPCTWFSNLSYTLLCLLPRASVGNTAAPPIARLLYVSGGRMEFAVCQLIICGIAVVGAPAIQVAAKFSSCSKG